MKVYPKKNQFVKIYLKNSFIIKGLVYLWDQEQVIIHDEDDIIVLNDTDQIFLVKIQKQKKVVQNVVHKQPEPPKPAPQKPVFVDEAPKPREYHKDQRLRALDMAELHLLRAEEERKRAREKLTTFKAEDSAGSQSSYVNYGYMLHKSLSLNSKKKD